jgi:hypothetical protein
MTEEKKTPEVIEDTSLEDASGGLLVPAIQKVREAAARSSTAGQTTVNQGVLNATPPKPEN